MYCTGVNELMFCIAPGLVITLELVGLNVVVPTSWLAGVV
jgi:hypothetical protein